MPAPLLSGCRWPPGQCGYLHLHQYARRPLHPGPPPPLASGKCRIGCCGTGRGTAGKRSGPAVRAAGGAIQKLGVARRLCGSAPLVRPALTAAEGCHRLGLQRPRLQVCPRDRQHPRRPGAEPGRRECSRSGHRAAPPPQGAARPGRGAGRIAGRCHMKLAAYE